MEPATFAIVPPQGPIRVDVHAPATAHRCGAVFHIDLSEFQAALVRIVARQLDMGLDAFVTACLDLDLPDEPQVIPKKVRTLWRKQASERERCSGASAAVPARAGTVVGVEVVLRPAPCSQPPVWHQRTYRSPTRMHHERTQAVMARESNRPREGVAGVTLFACVSVNHSQKYQAARVRAWQV